MAWIAMAYIIATGIVLDRDIIINNIHLYSGMLPVIMVISSLLLNINGLYSIGLYELNGLIQTIKNFN
jgi:hypothetical protein